MIKLAMIAVVLSIVASAAGAGIAGCRNSAESAAESLQQSLGSGQPTAQGLTAAPSTAGNEHQAEIAMLRGALEQATEAMHAAQEQIASLRRATRTRPAVNTATRAASLNPIASEPRRAAAAPLPISRTAHTPAARPVPEVAIPAVAIPRETRITASIDTLISSATAVVEQRVTATTSRDVRVDGVVAIAAGSRIIGSVTAIERSGRMRGSESITVRFHTVVNEGVETPLKTQPITRTGPGQARQNASRIGGGAAIGAVLGGIFGGHKGAAIGGAIGGAGGTAAAAAEHAAPAEIGPAETVVLTTTRTTTL